MADLLHPGGVDFHCHLDLYPDHEAAIARAESARVYTLTVTTTPKAWTRNHELTRGTRYVRAALGLHPQLVAERSSEFPIWERHLAEARYVGEVGLDAGPRFYKSLDLQKHIFRRVLERCAEVGGKILTVHSVRSASAVLDMIEQYLPQVGVWLCSTGLQATRVRRDERSNWVVTSPSREMIRSDRGKALIASLPMDRLLTETDGPFTETGGRPAEPADVQFAVEAVAQIRNLAADTTAQAIKKNLRTILGAEVPKGS